jgi:DNA-binding PadR family transcriptional regulator
LIIQNFRGLKYFLIDIIGFYYFLTTISVADIVWRMSNTDSIAPLTPAVFHILLAVSGEARHGYGIMKQVETDSHGKIMMGAGTLYGSIKRMLDAGLIKESERRVDPAMDNERRIYYEITGVGERALAAEIERYRNIVDRALELELLPKTFVYAG